MNWQKLISDLQAAGMTQKAIGAALGKSQIWVSDVLRGRYDDLKWADGETLRRLHAETTAGQKVASAQNEQSMQEAA